MSLDSDQYNEVSEMIWEAVDGLREEILEALQIALPELLATYHVTLVVGTTSVHICRRSSCVLNES